MLSLCLTLFAAAQTPNTTGLELAGEGRRLRLVDATGDALSTEQALRALGRDDLAEQARRHRNLVRGGSIALWSGGGLLLLAGNNVNSVETPNLVGSDSALNVPGLAIMGAGLAAAGGGFALYFADPKKPLSAWMDPMEIETILAEQASAPVTGAPPLPGDRMAPYRPAGEGSLWIDGDGVLRMGSRRVNIESAVRLFNDDAMADRYRETRERDKALWIPITAVGGAMAVGGSTSALVGLVLLIGGGMGLDDDMATRGALLFFGGGLAATLGAGGVAAGTTGLIVTAVKHNRAEFYYTPEELRTKVGEYNNNAPLPPGVMPLPEAKLQVMPMLGLGIVGIQGTF
jgi:hypothetical protein